MRCCAREMAVWGVVAFLLSCWGCSPQTAPPAPKPPSGDVSGRQVAPARAPAAVSEEWLVAEIRSGGQLPPDRAAFVEAVRRIDQLGGSLEFDDAGNLIGVDLADNRVVARESDLDLLFAFAHLEKLKIASADVGPEGIARIARLENLRELALWNSQIDAAGLAKLGALDKLEVLDLKRSVKLDDDAMAELKHFSHLRQLMLVDNLLGNAAIDHLVSDNLRGLRLLDLRGCSQIDAAGLKKLAVLPGLAALKLRGDAIDDASLAVLGRLPALTSLAIEDSPVTDDGLKALGPLRLEDLSLARCFSVTDEGLAALTGQPALRQLSLRDMMINGSQIGRLAGLPDLKVLRLREVMVGDDAVAGLAKLAGLERLDLAQTMVSDAGVAELQKALPACKIVVDQ